MIKLTSGQRQDSHTQPIQFFICNTRMFTQGQSELGIHIVIWEFTSFFRTFYQQINSPITQQPNTDIHQEQVSLHQFSQLLDRRFLKHKVQFIGIATRRNKHPVILCQIGVHPKPIAHNINIRNILKRLTRTYIHISAGYQCAQRSRSLLHYLFI